MGLFDFFKKKPTIPPEALLLWVHRSTHFEHLSAIAARREEPPFRSIPLGPVFSTMPALLTNDGYMPLSEAHLEALDMDFEAAFQRAVQNTRPLINQAEVSDGLFMWQGNGRDAAMLAGPVLRKHLDVKGELVMMLPAEGLVLAAGSEDEQALARMLDVAEQAYGQSPEFRSLRAVVVGDDPRSAEWLPPEDHPLSTRFRMAAARTFVHEAQGDHEIFAGGSPPLAPLAVTDAHGGTLTAAWVRDADVVVPVTADRLVLLDTPDQPMPRVEISLEALADTFPEALEFLPCTVEEGGDEVDEQDDEAENESRLFRLRGALFPTAHERKFLLQRSAFLAQSPDDEPREVPAAELLADFDQGATLVVRADRERAAAVRLASPDGRTARCSAQEFGARVERLPLLDQSRYYQSFAVMQLTRLMTAVLSGQRDADVPPEPADGPVTPEGLHERAAASHPLLLSSNELRKLRDEFAQEPNEAARALVLTALETWEPALMFPIVRPPGYETGKTANIEGMAKGRLGEQVTLVDETRAASRPAAEGLRLDLVSDRGNRVMVVDAARMTPTLLEAAWRTALLNLEAASLKPMRREAEGRYAGDWHDDYDFSRVLLLPRLVTACQVKGAPLVFAPTVGRVWVTGADDVAGQTAVLDAIDAFFGSGDATSPYQFRQLLFGWPWTVQDGALVRWTLPAGHPLAARIEALDAQLAKRRASSATHVGDFARAVMRPGGPTDESQA